MPDGAGGAADRFERYLAGAGPRGGAARLAGGLVLLAALVFALGAGLVLLARLWFASVPGLPPGAVEARVDDLLLGRGVAGLAFMLGSIAALWPALWIVLRIVHRQRLGLLFAPEGRIGAGGVMRGGLVIGALSGALLLAPGGGAIERTALPPGEWIALALPMAALIFAQATAEELVFRGYLLQRLAQLSRHWLVWAALPSALFALLHWNPVLGPREQWFYFGATFTFGLAAALTVRRTGSLATAIGMHWGSNVIAMLVVAEAGFLDDAALFIQRGGATGAGLAAGFAAMVALLAWLASPLSPLPRERGSGSA